MSNVVVGGGHFVERGGQMVQQFANHVQVGSRAIGKLDEIKGAIESCFDWTQKYNHQDCEPFPEYRGMQNIPNVPISPTLVNRASSGFSSESSGLLNFGRDSWKPNRQPGIDYTMTLCSNDLDSDAWGNRWNDFKDSHLAGSIKEFGLALGSGMAGDGQGAVEHGAAAAQEWWLSRQEMADRTDALRGTWQNDAR